MSRWVKNNKKTYRIEHEKFNRITIDVNSLGQFIIKGHKGGTTFGPPFDDYDELYAWLLWSKFDPARYLEITRVMTMLPDQ